MKIFSTDHREGKRYRCDGFILKRIICVIFTVVVTVLTVAV